MHILSHIPTKGATVLCKHSDVSEVKKERMYTSHDLPDQNLSGTTFYRNLLIRA